MPFVKPLTVGARVRLNEKSSPLGVGIRDSDGTVVRIDGRGVPVKFDSGREFLVEPAMLDALA